MNKRRAILIAILLLASLGWCELSVADSVPGNVVTYRLPWDGQERTYRVTLAAAPGNDPDWIVGTFVAGAVRTVNEENKGVFSETWDGLDDNFMPVPPGRYVVKGIYASAEKWAIDGQYHSLIPDYVASPGDSWAAEPDNDHRFPIIHGHVFEPIYEVVPASNGTAMVLGGYVENWYNPFIIDLNKAVGIDQVVRKLPSHGRSGGQLAAYDGTHGWLTRWNEVYCPTNPRFGVERNKYKHGISKIGDDPKKLPTDMAAVNAGGRTLLYISEPEYGRITVMDGGTGRIVSRLNKQGVFAVAEHPSELTLLSLVRAGDAWRIDAIEHRDGAVERGWSKWCDIPADIGVPRDLTVDGDGYVYVITGRVIRKLDRTGRVVATFGKDQRLRGTWNPQVMIGPRHVNVRRDPAGRRRILVTTTGAPQRVIEWNTDDGTISRDWMLTQNGAGGYCMDPHNPSHVYTTALIGPQLIRYVVNYDTGDWRVDAVWEGMCHSNMDTHFPAGRMFPQIVHHDGHKYLCFAGGGYRTRGGWMIYRYLPDADDWIASAAVIKGKWWHDANDDGRVQDDEFTGGCPPYFNGNYWAGKVLPGMTLANINNNWWFVQHKQPDAFDTHGNPVYRDKHVETLTDPFLDARRKRRGTSLDPLRGGNEIGDKYWNWSDVTGSLDEGFYVASVHKPDGISGYKFDEAGQVCAEWKLTRWAPNGDGKFEMKWRVGRKAFGPAKPGEAYAPFHISPPAHGMVGFQDGNGLYHVYTTDGLYVDTLMYDRFRFGNMERGGMFTHSGGSYYGRHYLNRDDGRVYIFMGRASNNIYVVPNWHEGFLKRLDLTDSTITLTDRHIANPPKHVIDLRRKHGLPVPKLKSNTHVITNESKPDKPKLAVADVVQPFDGKTMLKLTEQKVVAAKVGYYRLGVNHYMGDRRQKKPIIDGKECGEFLFAHAPSVVVYDIPPGYRTFTAVGTTLNNRDFAFVVKADGNQIYRSDSLAEHGTALPIRVTLPENSKRLELIIDALESSRADHSAWAYPRLRR